MPYDLPLAEAAAALALGFVACLAFAGRVRRQNLAFGLGLLVIVLVLDALERRRAA